MTYHYKECGLRHVYLQNGYAVQQTPYGETVAINDVAGLHRAIGVSIARRARLTGAELRFLRKEMGLSQRALATLIGSSEQNVSNWERKGRLSRMADRLVRVLYLESVEGNLQIKALLEELVALDEGRHERMAFQTVGDEWREAA